MGTKTPLMAMFRRAFRAAALANQQQNSNDAQEILEVSLQKRLDRRKFLRNAGRATVFLGASGLIQACQKDNEITIENQSSEVMGRSRSSRKVAIIGAGMAGLNAAHTLSKNGFSNFTIFESSNRVGGRMYSAKGVMGTNLVTELGGEFIDSIHDDMLQLAGEFNFTLLDTQAPSETALIKDQFYFGGANRTMAQVVTALQPFVGQMQQNINAVYGNNGAAQQFDQLSISAYLSQLGMSGWLKDFLEVAYETEYGLSCQVQTSLNLLWLISADLSGGKFEVFGESDERYKIAGGNQQLTDALANLYQNKIQTGKTLEAISEQGNQFYLTFSGSSTAQSFDLVLITTPFTRLRQVDLNLNLPSWKTNAINNLGYGTNAKLFLGFSSRYWRNLGYSGYYFTDNGAQTGWDNTQLQGGTEGGITVYTGGTTGVNLGAGSAASQASIFLPKVNQFFPGANANYNNKASRFHWPSHPHTLCSYACYTVGQGTTISGNEYKRVGKLFFAGEHCSEDYQGYMNGSAETGRKAAEDMLKFLS
jgi:monoamine oxidase